MDVTIVTAFIAGAISFFSPCILPMLTVYFTLITGLSIEELSKQEQNRLLRLSILVNTALFALGFGVVFTAAGAAAGQVGALLPRIAPIMTIVGGVFIIGFGLFLLGLDRIPFIGHILSLQKHHDVRAISVGGRGLTAFITGLIFAVACSHCIAPTLYSILLYAGTTGSAQSGALMMAAFSIGLAIPYLLVAIGFSQATNWLRRIRPYRRFISAVTGILMVLLGLLLLTGRFTLLTQWFSSILPFKPPFGM